MTIEKPESEMGQVLRIDAMAGEPPLGLEFPETMTFAQWEAEGRRLSQMSHAVQWYIGDWWNAGFRYGEEKREDTAKRLFGIDYGTVRNLGSVASRIGLSRRRDNVPFSYHVEVASLKDETAADALLDRADELTVRDLRSEVQGLKSANDRNIGTVLRAEEPLQKAQPQPLSQRELIAAYETVVEFAEAIQEFRELSRREQDLLSVALGFLGEAHGDRRPVPDDFEIVLVEKGRVACEEWYSASRITVNRWLLQCESGKRNLLKRRADFVRFGRSATQHGKPEVQGPAPDDPMFDIAQKAADFLRVNRYGGWTISASPSGGWIVGTVRKTSAELIAMAERQGFEPQSLQVEMGQGVR